MELTEAGSNPEAERFKNRIYIFTGVEGSGKTTQARLLSNKAGLPNVTFGDIFRDLAQNDPGEFGEACRQMFNEKRYQEPEMLFRIISEYLKREEYQAGFIVDGGLRTLGETENFERLLDTVDRRMPITVVNLRIPGWLSYERLTYGRKRSDDTVEGVRSRQENYFKDLALRMSFARSKWKFVTVLGFNRPKEEISSDILNKL